MSRESRAALKAERYAAEVVAALAGEFYDLGTPTIAGITRDAIARNVLRPDPAFAVAMDSQHNWRLKPDSEVDERRVRLACCRLPDYITTADNDREARITAELRQIRI